MAIIRTIDCADCGHSFETPRGNTRLDHVCRILRDFAYSTQLKRCQLCEETYHPINTKDLLCGTHTPPAVSDQWINCVYCGQVERSVRKDIAVCKVCARKTENRARLFRNLISRQEKQRNGTFTPQPSAQPPGVMI